MSRNAWMREQEHRAAMDAGPSAAVAAAAANLGSAQPAPPAMGFPTTYAVTKPEEESAAPPQSTVSSPGDNTKQLEDVYDEFVHFMLVVPRRI